MNLSQTVEEMSALGALALTWTANFLPRLFATAVILVAGHFIARSAARAVSGLLARGGHLDRTLWPAIASFARYGVLVIVFIAALAQLGVETTSILAVLGAFGLAIGLALQGTIANIAAGVMLLWMRPFRSGDAIETAAVTGTVREIGLVATLVDTVEGVFRFVPNAEIWNRPLSNFSRNPTRMTDIVIGIGYGSDIREARRILLDLARSEPRVVDTPAPDAFVDRLADSAVFLRYRVWIRTADFWPTQRMLVEEAKRRLGAAGIEAPFPQQVNHEAAERPKPPAQPRAA